MNRPLVLIDADTLACVCPFHGPQPEAEYASGRAPCGCLWDLDRRGVLRVTERGFESSTRLPALCEEDDETA